MYNYPPAINSYGGEVKYGGECLLALPIIFIFKKGASLDILNSIVAILTIASCLSAAFNYVVIRPLQHAIDLNSDVLHELKKEIERSVADRRALDVRVAALEEAHKINSKRLDEICSTLSEKSKR